MSLRDTLMEDVKTAMKAGEKAKLSTIRMIQAALKDKDIEARGLGKGQLTDDDILALMQKMVKQRQESIAIYTQAGRNELAAGEQAEVEVINHYLPRQMDEPAIKAAIAATIAETDAASMKDMGKVVAGLKARYAGQMDFAKASQLVKAALSG
ncbi:MAG: GatB/YqeY domain-containing protein [Methylocystis sp.]|nr:GatB/YqeY domain-containing protein [Methylocystis sp.]MCA3583808.1 GatB/YqeY domain-containing protein [Methylocystis sp.]MCA3586481.1 GatB/YqeY domain-containing protein [Methylocystis sp.]MCA3589918.1 GatB/YqeY domain-containing protein [Methylocystis sp.]